MQTNMQDATVCVIPFTRIPLSNRRLQVRININVGLQYTGNIHVHVQTEYGEEELQLHTFLTSVLDGTY
jgi:hypothetical protein